MYGIGCHETKARRFLASMDIPPPVSNVRAAVFRKRIHSSTKAVAKESMARAAEELKAAEKQCKVTFM